MDEKHSLQLLLATNDRPVKLLMERELPSTGPMVVAFRSGDDARDLLGKQLFDVSQLDFELPRIGRIETRRHQRGNRSSELVLVERQMAEAVDLDRVELSELEEDSAAVALDGDNSEYDFLTMPLTSDDLNDLSTEAARLLEERQTEEESPVEHPGGIITSRSSAMSDLLDIAQRIAAGSASVLIHGETGTGKTLIARHIHEQSPRADRRFVAINCSAFQDQLLESELFGHEKGSFTGAVKAKPGLFEVADGGTIFLDEIGEMTSAMQAKLLQVLDAGELRRVGGTEPRHVDVRVVAASNKHLPTEVKAGRFREDLLFRLNVIYLQVPPLRDRPQDITALAEHFLERFRLPGKARKKLNPGTLKLLKKHAWPGNVRELANVIEGLILLAPTEEILPEDLPPNLRPKSDLNLESAETPLPLSEIERLHIIQAMRYTEGKKAPAARLLGIDVKTLSNKIRNYEIEI